ncbi:MAG: radical SAM protein [Acidobacteria bacterium]|nr:radical SAM protein [Acidobacteriota bacterium]
MQVTEIFHSIQGESTYAGLPCTFVRLTGCPLRCRWCDSEYTFTGGQRMTVDEVIERVKAYPTKLVEITGGEPLVQKEVYPLSERLLNLGHRVLIETSGSFDISRLDPRVICIMDLKAPGSGHEHSNRWENIKHLKPEDEVKFVIADRRDFDWACGVIERYNLTRRVTVLFSPAWGICDPKDLAEWILRSGVEARMQVQLHKYIWGPDVQGV